MGWAWTSPNPLEDKAPSPRHRSPGRSSAVLQLTGRTRTLPGATAHPGHQLALALPPAAGAQLPPFPSLESTLLCFGLGTERRGGTRLLNTLTPFSELSGAFPITPGEHPPWPAEEPCLTDLRWPLDLILPCPTPAASNALHSGLYLFLLLGLECPSRSCPHTLTSFTSAQLCTVFCSLS